MLNVGAGAGSYEPADRMVTAVEHNFEQMLRRDLADGTWDGRYGYLRTQPEFDGSLILVVSRPAGSVP